MAQARDELFLKLALRQGLLSQQEAVQFLERYRSEGAPGEGIGHWLVAEGVLAEEQADVIRNAIAQRAEGHVADVRRRVPKTKAGGAGSGSRVAQAHHHHGHHGAHAAHRHSHSAPAGKKVTPAQQVIYIGSGVVAIGLLVFLMIAYQRSGRNEAVTSTPTVAQTPAKTETAAEAAARIAEQADSAAAPAPATMQWTDKEIESMRASVNDAVRLARNHVSDGRPGKGIDTIRKRVAELGETIPDAVQKIADDEIVELQKIVDAAYEDALADLRAAKEKSDSGALDDIYAQLELSCGPSYVEKAKKAME
jgi:hypothetical protein